MRLLPVLFSLLFILVPIKSFACYSASLFKIYPIGMSNDTIISVDMQISRYNALFLENESRTYPSSDVGWTIISFVTKYDNYQNPIETIQIDSIRLYKDNITNDLENLYEQAVNEIILKNKNIEFFKPDTLTFCNYSSECNDLLLLDEERGIRYKERHYPISILENRDYYGFSGFADFDSMPLMNIGSIRKFTAGQFQLIVVHVQAGQFFEGEQIEQSSWTDDILKAIYQEPIIYHGNGYDVFFITE